MQTMMACGHAANATINDGPACAICAPKPEAYEAVAGPNLEGREARCSCGATQPSSLDLAFFEYRGPGSRAAVDTCKHCRYAEVAHTFDGRYAPPSMSLNRHLCLNFDPPQQFEPHGSWDYDVFYCGCRGWD